MSSPWVLLGAVLAVLGAFAAGDYHGHKSEATTWAARIEGERADAAEQARAVEREKQQEINDVLRKQNEDLSGVNSGLAADLERLRNRPERPAHVPEHPRIDCPGATGADLSREDAAFLIGEAARADRLRAALAACYSYADALNPRIQSR